jgi:hypothetical protein
MSRTLSIALFAALWLGNMTAANVQADDVNGCDAPLGASRFGGSSCAAVNDTVSIGATVTDPGSAGSSNSTDMGSAGSTSNINTGPYEIRRESGTHFLAGPYCKYYYSDGTTKTLWGHCPTLSYYTTDNTTNTHSDPTPAATEETIREALLTITLPTVTPVLSPDGLKNEWGALAVNFPIWIDAKKPTPVTETTTHDGITITLTATPASYTINMGEGTPFKCSSFQARGPNTKPMDTSPVCGYAYKHKGTYTPTITTEWKVSYTTSTGGSGEFRHKGTPTPTTQPLQIIELVSVIAYDPNEHP